MKKQNMKSETSQTYNKNNKHTYIYIYKNSKNN